MNTHFHDLAEIEMEEALFTVYGDEPEQEYYEDDLETLGTNEAFEDAYAESEYDAACYDAGRDDYWEE